MNLKIQIIIILLHSFYQRIEYPFNDNYNGYILALAWAPSTCQIKYCNTMNKKGIWNLHGLWPDNYVGQDPQYCHKSRFNLNSLDGQTKNDLKNYWNGLYGNQDKFHWHEINKHGSCWNPSLGTINQMPQKIQPLLKNFQKNMNNHFKTFIQVSIELSKIYQPVNALRSQGITPGNYYHIDQVMNSLERKFRKGVMPICTYNNRRQLFLQELRFCLDKNFQIRNCQRNELSKKVYYCGKDYFQYPEFP